ncbi:MAG: putative hydrophobic protein (TIGR00271 family) [Sediminicola sp.]|jgi:uncharacterized hydrophobic protein (TIGR00271 family)|tara:strand:- start:4342 stop:5787 length:1446 start_codon:yes stop_codon:yes gene_type:complete
MENESDHVNNQNKAALKKDAHGLFKSLKKFFVELLDIRADTDRENTMNAIKADIPLKGATAWILICSIFVASIGLNANSTAVVIGAMLISPLMGPILGIGLSIAINDIDTLRKSLINFGIMVFLSVLTAFLFFWLFPLREESSELLARTKPDIRDVLIAFFGGLSLIIARTKKGTIASVIFGVAIATALMPPLCTVGYGLAAAVTDNSRGLEFAAGAMYLFIINTIFIALATFLVLKLLRFPMIKYANSKRRNNISRFASFLAILVMVPAGFTFVSVLRESAFNNNAKLFIERELNGLPNSSYMKKYATYDFSDTDISTIELTSFGADQIGESTMSLLRNRLLDYTALAKTNLVLNQSLSDNSFQDEVRYMEELRARDSLDLLTKDQKIVYLEERMFKLRRLEKGIIPFQEICIEAKINYENLETISYASTLISNFSKIDTLAVFNVTWDVAVSEENKEKDMKKLYEWLKYKIKMDTLLLK